MSQKNVWYDNPNPNPNLPTLWKFQSHFIHLLKIFGPLRPNFYQILPIYYYPSNLWKQGKKLPILSIVLNCDLSVKRHILHFPFL